MEEDKNKTTGILVSIGLHSIIILLFFVLPGFIVNQGINEDPEISLEDGTQAGDQGDYNELELSISNFENERMEDSHIITTEDPEGMVLPEAKKFTPKPLIKISPLIIPDKKPEKNAMYNPNRRGGKGNGTGEEGNGPGGSKDLEPKIEPTPKPNSPMMGRLQIAYPQFDNDFNEEGKLVFRIAVDAHGNITDIKTVVPSSITNSEQINKAKKLILTYAKFAAKPGAEEERGYYTIIFKKH